jgi:hypothetical protein
METLEELRPILAAAMLVLVALVRADERSAFFDVTRVQSPSTSRLPASSSCFCSKVNRCD